MKQPAASDSKREALHCLLHKENYYGYNCGRARLFDEPSCAKIATQMESAESDPSRK
jgi:hypothetical protein